MARTNAVNFSGALQFPKADAATDLFKKEDVQVLAAAVDGHDHSSGKGLALASGIITTGMIADGTIQTADIADNQITSAKITDGTIVAGDVGANEMTRLLGSYAGPPTWSTTNVGSWVETPIQIVGSVAYNGSYQRFAGHVTIQHSVANGWAYLAVGIDGTVSLAFGVAQVSSANGFCCAAWSVFFSGSMGVGTHRVSLFVNNSQAGTLTVSNATNNNASFVEYRR